MTSSVSLVERIARAQRKAAQRRYGSQRVGGEVPWEQASPGVRAGFTTAARAALNELAEWLAEEGQTAQDAYAQAESYHALSPAECNRLAEARHFATRLREEGGDG